MAHSQLHPLLVNPNTGEPYLRLPNPLDNIIITPPRMSDASAIVQHLNDPQVYKWLEGPPYPYLGSDAVDWLENITLDSDAALRELAAAWKEDPDGALKMVDKCPVRTLREVHDDGTETFLGDIGVMRCRYPDVANAEEKERLVEENLKRKAGDPNVVWCFGYYLASSHHGRGIMSAAVATLICEWLIPRMAVRHLRVETFKNNIGSRRVFEKNGFVLEKTIDYPAVSNSGELREGFHVLRWHAKE